MSLYNFLSLRFISFSFQPNKSSRSASSSQLSSSLSWTLPLAARALAAVVVVAVVVAPVALTLVGLEEENVLRDGAVAEGAAVPGKVDGVNRLPLVVVGAAGFVAAAECENCGWDDNPIEAKMSSSSPPITFFFFGTGFCWDVDFFTPRLVILVGMPPTSGGIIDEMLAVPPPLPLLKLVVPPEIGAGGGIRRSR